MYGCLKILSIFNKYQLSSYYVAGVLLYTDKGTIQHGFSSLGLSRRLSSEEGNDYITNN